MVIKKRKSDRQRIADLERKVAKLVKVKAEMQESLNALWRSHHRATDHHY